jgi:hypothetical protein
MITTTTTARRWLAALMTVGALGVAAPGVAHADVECHAIDATGTGRQTEPTSTVATIRGGGLLTGTTAGEFTVTPTSETEFLLAGTVTFTVTRATLAVDVAGTLVFTDPPTSALTFDVTSTGMSGTGRLAGATGELRLAGDGAADGSFTETVTGEICVDLSPQ